MDEKEIRKKCALEIVMALISLFEISMYDIAEFDRIKG